VPGSATEAPTSARLIFAGSGLSFGEDASPALQLETLNRRSHRVSPLEKRAYLQGLSSSGGRI
jgi:hypothetical protein